MVGFKIKKWPKEENSDYGRQKKELKKAWDFYDDRKHQEAEQIVNKILQKELIQDDIFISCLVLQSEILNRTGKDFKESYEIASRALNLAERINDPLLIMEASLATISSLIDQGDNTTIDKLLNKVDNLIVVIRQLFLITLRLKLNFIEQRVFIMVILVKLIYL